MATSRQGDGDPGDSDDDPGMDELMAELFPEERETVAAVDHHQDHGTRAPKGRKALRRWERELLLTQGPPNRGQSPDHEHMKTKTSKSKKESLGKEFRGPWVSPMCPLRLRLRSTTSRTYLGAHGAPHVSEAGQLLIRIFRHLMIQSPQDSRTA